MKKVDDQGATVSRTIFRVILIAGITAGISSVHAENNNNNNNGAITVKRIKYLEDHGNHKVVQVEDKDIEKGSNAISADTRQGRISPRDIRYDDDEDDEDYHAELSGISVSRGCPMCQSTTYKYTEKGGSGCSRGGNRVVGSIRANHGVRSRHFHDDTESDYDDYDSDYEDEEAEEEQYHRGRRRGVRGPADDFEHDPRIVFDFNPGRPKIDSRIYKSVRGNRGGGMSYGNGRREQTNGRGGPGYYGGGGMRNHHGYHDDTDGIIATHFTAGFDDDDGSADTIIHKFFSNRPYWQASRNAHPMSPSARKRMVLDSSNRNGYMLPNDVIDTVQDLIDDPSMFHVTFACQPKVGKYLCKIQCVKRDEELTGSCDSGYCHCILKTEKKDRKKMNKQFLAAMEGFKTDCATKAKKCKRYCKDLAPKKTYTGLCLNNKCRCVTYPQNPDNKRNACTKAIQKLKKIEDQALRCLGLPAIRAGSPAQGTLSGVTKDFMNKFQDSQVAEGCTPQDIQNLRGIISNLAQGLNYAKNSDAHSSATHSQEKAETIGEGKLYHWDAPTRSWVEPKEPGSPRSPTKVDAPVRGAPDPYVPDRSPDSQSVGYHEPPQNHGARPTSRSYALTATDDDYF